MRCAPDCLDDMSCQHRILHKRRALTVIDDLWHRAAHVDVDCRRNTRTGGIGCRKRPCGICHDLGLMTEDLHGTRHLPFGKRRKRRRLFIVIPHRLCRDHFADTPLRALLHADGAVSRIRHARHRRKHQPIEKRHTADRKPNFFFHVCLLSKIMM